MKGALIAMPKIVGLPAMKLSPSLISIGFAGTNHADADNMSMILITTILSNVKHGWLFVLFSATKDIISLLYRREKQEEHLTGCYFYKPKLCHDKLNDVDHPGDCFCGS